MIGRVLSAVAITVPLISAAAEPAPSGAATTLLAPAPPASSSPAKQPPAVVTLPQTDWAAAGKAEGVVANADLAGDPASVTLHARPDPAATDSYFNSKDWQQYQAFARHGRVGTAKQFQAMGKDAALELGNLAVGQAIEDALK